VNGGWKVELSNSARRELRQLDDGSRQAAAELLEELAEDPALVHAIELRGKPDTWRARFHHDRYRMIYQISKGRRHIRVTRIRARPTAYEGMKS
jgi:mRNA-degrading endonuclease RelE of RelBE toxin-antitoxin system